MSLRETRLGNGGKGWHSCRHSPHLWHVMFGFMMKQCDVFKDEIDRLSLAKWCWLGIVENPGEGWKQTRKSRAKMKVTQLTLVVAVKAWKSSNRPAAMLAGTLQSVTATFCTIPGVENVLWTRKETRYSANRACHSESSQCLHCADRQPRVLIGWCRKPGAVCKKLQILNVVKFQGLVP